MPDGRPNVLFLLSDQHSFRYLPGSDGSEPVYTPALGELASSSARFERAYCPAPLCTPSRLSLFTGRYIRGAGGWSNASHLRPELETVAGTFSAAGYATCHVGKMHFGGDRQFAGFDDRPYGDFTDSGVYNFVSWGHQDNPPSMTSQKSSRERITDAGALEIPESALQERTVVEEAVTFLREHEHANPDQPWFLNPSFSRPHFPLIAPRRHLERYWDVDAGEPTDRLTAPPVGFEGDTTDHPALRGRLSTDDLTREEAMRARAAYFACVDFLDEIVGDFLARLEREGFLENTIVVYTSDHGELAGEHGRWNKRSWHEASTRVPLVIQTPAHRSGDRDPARIETPVSLVDLYPTFCGLAGVEAPDGLDGVDLSGSVRSGTEPDRRPVFTDLFRGTEFRMVREGRYKYVGFRDAPELLFDLEADPGERTNLAPDAEGEDAAALDRLRGVFEDTIDFGAIDRERERDERAFREAHRIGVPEGTGNGYRLGDGRIVDADTPLYHPHVLVERPDIVFEDDPGPRSERS